MIDQKSKTRKMPVGIPVEKLSQRGRLLIVLGMVFFYSLGFALLHQLMGGGVAALAVIPVCAAGWLLGTKGGALAGPLAFPLNTLLFNLLGETGWDVVLRLGGGPGSFSLVLIGALVGRLSEVTEQLKWKLIERQAVEAALRQKEARLKSVLTGAPIILFALDQYGTVTLSEGRSLRELGLRNGDLVGQSAFELGGRFPQMVQDLRQALTGKAFTSIVEFGDSTFEIRYSPNYKGDGTFVGVIAVGLDITGRKRMESALRESEERFRNAFEYAAVGMALAGIDGRFLRVNRAFCEILGYSEDELLKLSFREVTHPEDLEEIAQNAARLLTGEIEGFHLEKRFVHRSGNIVWAQQSASVVQDGYGNPLYYFSQLQDVSERKKADAVLNRKLYEMQLINRVIDAAVSTREPNEVLRILCRELARALKVPQAAVGLLNPARTHLNIVAEYCEEGRPSALGEVIPVTANPVTEYVLQHRTPLVVPDAQNDPRMEVIHDLMCRRGTVSLLIVPLILRGQLIGTLGLDATESRQFTEDEVALVQNIAASARQMLENIQLYNELQQELADRKRGEHLLRAALNRTETLYQTAHALITSESLPVVLQEVVDRAAAALQADRVILVIYDEERGEIDRFVEGGDGYLDGAQVSAEEMGLAAGGGALKGTGVAPRVGNHAAQTDPDPEAVPSSRPGAGARIVAPLSYRGETLGNMTAINRPGGRDFTQQDLELLMAIANQTAVAIETARLFDEVQRQAVTDPLTGLYNRRGLYELGEREVDRARRFDRPLSAIMLDIDEFKKVNDRYGHTIGDQVLRIIAERCADLMRKVDVLCRYGGEEFAFLLPETDLAAARQVAERLRVCISGSEIETERGPLPITISLGVAPLTDEIPDLANLLDAADAAMYAAKEAGRNRVVVWERATSRHKQG